MEDDDIRLMVFNISPIATIDKNALTQIKIYLETLMMEFKMYGVSHVYNVIRIKQVYDNAHNFAQRVIGIYKDTKSLDKVKSQSGISFNIDKLCKELSFTMQDCLYIISIMYYVIDYILKAVYKDIEKRGDTSISAVNIMNQLAIMNKSHKRLRKDNEDAAISECCIL